MTQDEPGAAAPAPVSANLARRLPALLLAFAAVLAGAVAARHWLLTQAALPPTAVATLYPAPRPLPPFELTAQDGSRFDGARLRGHWSLLLFGFTSCADACPTTLLELAAARRSLADLPAALAPQVVLVSVDPARDTPARLADYLRHFDAGFIGLTGAPATLAGLAARLGVAVQRGAVVEGSYTVDHGATVFLVDPQAAVTAIFPLPHRARAIAADYRAIIGAHRAG